MICPWAGNLTTNFWKMSNPHPIWLIFGKRVCCKWIHPNLPPRSLLALKKKVPSFKLFARLSNKSHVYKLINYRLPLCITCFAEQQRSALRASVWSTNKGPGPYPGSAPEWGPIKLEILNSCKATVREKHSKKSWRVSRISRPEPRPSRSVFGLLKLTLRFVPCLCLVVPLLT